MEVQIITKESSNEKSDTVDKNMYCFSNCKQTSEWSASVKQFVASNIYTSLDMTQTGKKMHYIFIKKRVYCEGHSMFFKFSVSAVHLPMD